MATIIKRCFLLTQTPLVLLFNDKDVWGKDTGVGLVCRISFRKISVHSTNIRAITFQDHDTEHPLEDLQFTDFTINSTPIATLPHPLVRANQHVQGLVFAVKEGAPR